MVRAISHSQQGLRVFNILKEKNKVQPESRFTCQRSKCPHRESASSLCQRVPAVQLNVQQQSSDKVMRKEKWIKFGHKRASHILLNSQATQQQPHSALSLPLPQYKPVVWGTGTAAFPAEKLKLQKSCNSRNTPASGFLGRCRKKRGGETTNKGLRASKQSKSHSTVL